MSALDKIAPYYKAVVATLVPLLGSVGFALTSASDGGTNITTGEWVQAVVLALVGGGTVFSIPNKDPQARHQAESVQPPEFPHAERGAFDTSILIAVAAVIVIVAGLIYIARAF